MATNRASGNDRIPAQIGRVLGHPTDTGEPSAEETPARKSGAPINIRSGNARVGVQTDSIDGDVTIVIIPRRKA